MKTLKWFNIVIALFITNTIITSCKKDDEKIDINKNLIAYYPFNGNALDESLNYHDGTVKGAEITSDRNNKNNSAYFFDGNSNIEILDNNFLNNLETFSICLWVYPTELKYAHNTIISKTTPQRDIDLKIRKSDLKYNVRFAHDYPTVTHYVCNSVQIVELNTWTHIIYQWTGTKLQIFINGVLSSEEDFTGKTPPWTGTIMTIGSMANTEFFTGKIDNIRIYDKTLTLNEIELIYKNKE
ncbi:MAG: LamG domain-containing protein [Prolixibacteraceae bacterium]|nr:LamG domain-containing protein [Prolixibacteraceae bacterium]